MDLLERLAKTLTSDNQVSVVMEGEGCFVNMETKEIHIPAIAVPEGEPFPTWIVGYLDHEVGHLTESSATEQKRVIKEFEKDSPYEQAVAGYVYNVIDDTRQEQLFIRRYPGSRYYLGEANEFDLKNAIVHEEKFGANSNKALKDPRILAAIAYLFQFRVKFYDPAAKCPQSPTPQAIMLAFEWFATYDQLTEWTHRQLADRVIEFVRSIKYDPTEAEKQAAAGQCSHKEAGAGGVPVPGECPICKGKGKKGHGQTNGKGGSGHGEKGKDGKPELDSERPTMGGHAQTVAEQDQAGIDFLKSLGHEGRKKEFSAKIKEVQTRVNKKGTLFPPLTTAFDKVIPYADLIEQMLHEHPDVHQMVQTSIEGFDATTTNVLGAVQRKFLGEHRVRVRLSEDGDEFADTAYVQIATREKSPKDLYTTLDSRNSMKGTAVTLLLDGSGSMVNASSTLMGKNTVSAISAIWSVYALAQVLKCPFEILLFSTYYNSQMESRSYSNFRRTEAVVTQVVKPFSEKWSAKHKAALVALAGQLPHDYLGYSLPELKIPTIGKFVTHPDAQKVWIANCDGENVMVARRRLLSRPERKKIMIVVSDGNPVATGVPGEHIQEHLRYEIGRTKKAGVTVVGIGIGSRGEYVRDFYPVHRHLKDPSELGAALIQLL